MQLRLNAGKIAPRAQVSSRKSHRAGRWGHQQSRRGRPGERAPSAGKSWQGRGPHLPGQPWTRLKEARVNSHRLPAGVPLRGQRRLPSLAFAPSPSPPVPQGLSWQDALIKCPLPMNSWLSIYFWGTQVKTILLGKDLCTNLYTKCTHVHLCTHMYFITPDVIWSSH